MYVCMYAGAHLVDSLEMRTTTGMKAMELAAGSTIALLTCCVCVCVCVCVPDAAVEEERLLRHDGEAAPQPLQPDLRRVLPVHLRRYV